MFSIKKLSAERIRLSLAKKEFELAKERDMHWEKQRVERRMHDLSEIETIMKWMKENKISSVKINDPRNEKLNIEIIKAHHDESRTLPHLESGEENKSVWL
jgi:hypothetical protein